MESGDREQGVGGKQLPASHARCDSVSHMGDVTMDPPGLPSGAVLRSM